jgi:hypothetical protein
MTKPTVIRASALSQYPDCNRRGAARLFWREIEAAGFKLRHTARSIGALIGTAVHRAAESMLIEKAISGSLPPVTVATDHATEELGEQMREGEIAFDGTGPTYNRGDAEAQTLGMTRIYHAVVAPQVRPLLIEHRLEAEAASGLVLSGQPDVVALEPSAIRDLKTGARRSASHAPQLGAYSLLSRSLGLDIEEASIDFLQRVRSGRPQPDPVSKPVPVAQAETAATNILRHIESDLRTFREGDPERRILPGDPWAFQANPASVLCHPKWCPAFGTEFCKEGDPAKEMK